MLTRGTEAANEASEVPSSHESPPGPAVSLSGKAQARAETDRFDSAVLNQGH